MLSSHVLLNSRIISSKLLSSHVQNHSSLQINISQKQTHKFSPFTHAPAFRSSPAEVMAAKGPCSNFAELSELGLNPELMPKHVAVIMDGNRRWAVNRMLPARLGHRVGLDNLKQLAIHCSNHGILVFTAFVFSTENWTRPQVEVDFLMDLFEGAFGSEFNELIEGHNIRISVIGERTTLPPTLQSRISYAEDYSKDNDGMRLVFALNYSGLYDITEASKKLAQKVKDKELEVEDIDHAVFKKQLVTSELDYPDPDLIIRTSGELRISNFMLCQLAYSELIFVDTLFPDFKEVDLVESLIKFQRRHRRFGGHKYEQKLHGQGN